jgi:hypothetical protein
MEEVAFLDDVCYECSSFYGERDRRERRGRCRGKEDGTKIKETLEERIYEVRGAFCKGRYRSWITFAGKPRRTRER